MWQIWTPILIMIILVVIFFQCIILSNGQCCISWTKNNDLTDRYRERLAIRNSTSICTLGECMAVCTADPACMSVGFDEGNCFCSAYDTFSTSDPIEPIHIQGWKHFDIQQGLYLINIAEDWIGWSYEFFLRSFKWIFWYL